MIEGIELKNIPVEKIKIGEYYMLYNCLNKFTIAKIIGLKEVPCKIITNKMMNNRIKQLNFSRRDHKLKEIEL